MCVRQVTVSVVRKLKGVICSAESRMSNHKVLNLTQPGFSQKSTFVASSYGKWKKNGKNDQKLFCCQNSLVPMASAFECNSY